MPSPTNTVRFGPFQLDLRAAELHNNGTKIKLPEQSFQILVELVERPGEVITREELRQRLWHSDTFVDFEHSLNTAVRRLRQALGESAENPLYIETLPRHGYRLIVPVERLEPVAPAIPAVPIRKVLVPIAVLLVAAAITGTLYFRSHPTTPRLTDKDTIILSDFDNRTGDPVFDDTLKQGLSVQLEQSPFLGLISERKVNQTLKLMERPDGDRLTPEVTRDVCQRTGSKAMLTGSIAGLGSHYVIGLKAVNCSTGDVLAQAQEEAAGKEAVLKALDNAAVSLRRKLGESLSSVQEHAAPLEEVTTPSLEALKAYSLGTKTLYAKGEIAALPFYKRAAELDANFAMAYVWMARIESDSYGVERGADYERKSYDLREKVSERERLAIEGRHYVRMTGELDKGMQTFELYAQIYPRDDHPHRSLGIIADDQGNWEKALEEFREALHLEPTMELNYGNLAVAYMALNRLDEAEAVLKKAEVRKLESESLLRYSYWLAFLKGGAAQMPQLFSAAMGKPDAEDLLLATQADTEAWYGKLKNAHELTERAMDSAKRNDDREGAAAFQAAAALRAVESGKTGSRRVPRPRRR
jgi:DNA-binding winged helix-turn-helix (wHTH) protein/tetratricopeptide (TPR) repeat protein